MVGSCGILLRVTVTIHSATVALQWAVPTVKFWAQGAGEVKGWEPPAGGEKAASW